MSAKATGLSGASLSMFETVKLVTSEMFPAASVPRKNTVPFAVNWIAAA